MPRYPISGIANHSDWTADRPELTRCWRHGEPPASSIGRPSSFAFIRTTDSLAIADGLLRASLDKQVRAASPRGAPSVAVANGSVLELKTSGELPLHVAHLGKLGLRRSAHSKYALAIELLYGGDRTFIR